MLSQIYILGVFGLEKQEYFVVEEQKEICGAFTPGTSENPNWLPQTWSQKTCEETSLENCCNTIGYLFVGPVGDARIPESRYAAEFLASKNIIESQSLSPVNYQLENTITRKEMMKIIANISDIELSTNCSGIFQDVVDDWGCKYIEGALNSGFVAQNQNFRPDATLTQAEALKLIFQARGLERRYQTNSWQQDYISSALYLGYIDEKPTEFNAPATRSWIFLATAKTYNEY
ncbi:S-layer homology domain-containing protein [Candidatus Gracilibacteria bacterium]|nr:S-layer homology domain-containing protein [Candidatus Gracilibacteria bacterium]